MTNKIVFPEFAEDGDEEAKVIAWNAKVGDKVEEGEEIIELLTDKATFTVPAPSSGILTEIKTPEESIVKVGAVLGSIENK
jgi:pyruvate/2-oxoglutarate dehydrogenase complex dihydrolipoamide acyltransferase (E2) component